MSCATICCSCKTTYSYRFANENCEARAHMLQCVAIKRPQLKYQFENVILNYCESQSKSSVKKSEIYFIEPNSLQIRFTTHHQMNGEQQPQPQCEEAIMATTANGEQFTRKERDKQREWDGYNSKYWRGNEKILQLFVTPAWCLMGCTVITIEMFCIRLILWLWMKWCGLTTTKHHIIPNLCGRKLNLLFFFIIWFVQFFSFLVWNRWFFLCIGMKFRICLLYVIDCTWQLLAIGYSKFNTRKKFQCILHLIVTEWQAHTKMCSIKLLDNCYLFEYDQCAVSTIRQTKRKCENTFAGHHFEKIDNERKKSLCKRCDTRFTLHTIYSDRFDAGYLANHNELCSCLSWRKMP